MLKLLHKLIIVLMEQIPLNFSKNMERKLPINFLRMTDL